MRIRGEYGGLNWTINGISVGGGSVVISRINGVETRIDGNCYTRLFILKDHFLTEEKFSRLKDLFAPIRVCRGNTGEGELICFESLRDLAPDNARSLETLLEGGCIVRGALEPILPFPDLTGNAPLFTTFAELLECCKDKTLPEAALAYEANRSGKSIREIKDYALKIIEVIEESMSRGREGNNPLLCGYCSGSDGMMMDQWGRSGKSITGGVFNDALAGALSMAEVSASAGRVVAVPTSGSAGGMPGALFAVAKRFNSGKEALADAFLAGAAVGVIIGNSCSFSGSIGGCQVEVGIGAAMAAAGACCLAGGSVEAALHAVSLVIKNCLGLVCDPLAGPVEVPCIKRNALGAALALMGAEMALAGVRSVVPPDQVVMALRDTQDRIPTELRGACVGGLASAPIARDLQALWAKKLEENREL
jgi:L-serine dehydratase